MELSFKVCLDQKESLASDKGGRKKSVTLLAFLDEYMPGKKMDLQVTIEEMERFKKKDAHMLHGPFFFLGNPTAPVCLR